MKMGHPLHVLGMLILTGITFSCIGGDEMSEMSDYVRTTQSGIARLPWPKQMEQLFGDSDHFITEYGFSPGPRIWNTEVFFYGRYSLALQVDVAIDYKAHTVVTNVGPPKFYLYEVGSLVYNSSGLDGAKIAKSWVFNGAQWDKLVASKGDWSALGISVKTNSPIPDFDSYANAERSPRVRIPH
jgi:hypothetical protein